MSKRTAKSATKPVTPPLAESQSAVAIGEELIRQYPEWRQSFQTPAKRMTFIQTVCNRIAEEFKPEKIILFGSHAYGKPTLESDLDLLVVMPFEGSPLSQSVKISRQLGLMLPIDLIVRTPEQLEERLAMEDDFMREIVEQGKVMYEAHHR